MPSFNFNEQDPNIKLKRSRLKKRDCFSVDGFSSHCNTVSEETGCFHQFCARQKKRPSRSEEDIKRGSKKRELNELIRRYRPKKNSSMSMKCESMSN